MSWRRSAAIAEHEMRLTAREPGIFIQLILMPLLMIAFLKPAFAPALQKITGHPVNGADQAVPGMVTMFSFFTAGFVAFAIFREHGWNTWNRLRASQARSLEIMTGKVTPSVLLTLVQQFILFAIGVGVFGLSIRGSSAGLVLVSIALTFTLVSLGLLLAAVLRSSQQVNTISGVLTFALAGVGGAFSPLGVLPGWAQAIAPLTPTYWAMEGYQNVILHGHGVVSTLRPSLALLGFTAAFTAIASWRLRFDEAKHWN